MLHGFQFDSRKVFLIKPFFPAHDEQISLVLLLPRGRVLVALWKK